MPETAKVSDDPLRKSFVLMPHAHTALLVFQAVVVAVLITAALFSTVFTDYLNFITEYADRYAGFRTLTQFALVAFLYVLFAALVFDLVIARAAHYPSKAEKVTLFIDILARTVIVLSPTFVLMVAFYQSAPVAQHNWLTLLTLVLLSGSIVVQLYGFKRFHPSLAGGEIPPRQRTISVYLLPAAIVSVAALYVWIWLDITDATLFISGLGVIFLFLIFLLVCQRLLTANPAGARPVVGFVLLAILLCNIIPFGTITPEFRHSRVALDASPSSSPSSQPTRQTLVQARGVPTVTEAFEQWLTKRLQRSTDGPAAKKYPVFVIAAQGGGQYAAYHTALFLARLYDHCPRIGRHIFAVSGVSGGAVGSAVVAEFLRNSPPSEVTCSRNTPGPGAIEKSVRSFFSHDFVTPVVATGLMFDLPALLIPQIRVTHDRATTLELAFERAWKRSAMSPFTGGLDRNFFGAWSADGPAPALFFNTTSANYGLPVVVSELYIAQPASASLLAFVVNRALRYFDRPNASGSPAQAILTDRRKIHEAIGQAMQSGAYTRPSYFNILQFRSDLQLKLSTAATLSARFPYVTPPGVLYRNAEIQASDDTLKRTAGFQLIDGGFWDNSGMATAMEIVGQIQQTERTNKLTENVEFHLISFSHAKTALQKSGEDDAQSELVTPVATFEAVRQARRIQVREALAAGFKDVHLVELFDHEFQAPLTWTLSGRIREKIEARSGGDEKPSLCCALNMSGLLGKESIVLDLGPAGIELAKVDPPYVSFVAPNKDVFDEITRMVTDAR